MKAMRVLLPLVLFAITSHTQTPSNPPSGPPTNPPTDGQWHNAKYSLSIKWYKWEKEDDTNPCVEENLFHNGQQFEWEYKNVTDSLNKVVCDSVCADGGTTCKDEDDDVDENHVGDFQVTLTGHHPENWHERVVKRVLDVYPNGNFVDGSGSDNAYEYYGPAGSCKANKGEPSWEQEVPCNFAHGPQCSADMHAWEETWPYAFEIEDTVSCEYPAPVPAPTNPGPAPQPTEPADADAGWGIAAVVIVSVLAFGAVGLYCFKKRQAGYKSMGSTASGYGATGDGKDGKESKPAQGGTMVEPL